MVECEAPNVKRPECEMTECEMTESPQSTILFQNMDLANDVDHFMKSSPLMPHVQDIQTC